MGRYLFNVDSMHTGPDGHALHDLVEKAGILELTAAWLLQFYLCTLDQMVTNWMSR